ncbi:MAG TPA: 6-bladed beta-propeller [Gemmatimonadales bacterium]
MTAGQDTLLVAVAIVLGCSPTDREASPDLVDSLGITVIEYPTSFAETPGASWSTDPEPLFSLGESTPELHRVSTALFQADGGVVVANGGAYELLFFDPTGQMRARVGREGGGPGEFHQLTSLSVGPADSLFAYDARENRISVFDRNGVFARALTLPGRDTLGPADQLDVMITGQIIGAFHRRTSGVGLVRDSLVVMMFTPSGEPATHLGVFPHMHTDWGPHPIPGGQGSATFPLPVPFSSLAAVGVGDGSIHVGLPDRYAVMRLTRDGPQRVTRQRDPLGPVTEAHRDRLFAALAAGRLNTPELDVLRGLKGATTLPGFGRDPLTARLGERTLLVTDLDGVWLQPFQLPSDSIDAPWPRFSADGLYEGVVMVPPGFRPTAVRGEIVLGVYQDSRDVEFVRAYRVVRRH